MNFKQEFPMGELQLPEHKKCSKHLTKSKHIQGANTINIRKNSTPAVTGACPLLVPTEELIKPEFQFYNFEFTLI